MASIYVTLAVNCNLAVLYTEYLKLNHTMVINISATLLWPLIAATCRGVIPSSFFTFTRSGTFLSINSTALQYKTIKQ